MKGEAKWNTEKQTGTYGQSMHHGELIPGSLVISPNTPTQKQNLAGQKGMEGARKSLIGRYKKQ